MKTFSIDRPRPPARGLQTGFTLVELITVILILGVLAAVALPRFADLQGKARESKVKAVAGSMRAAASLVKATAMANGTSCAGNGIATLEGMAINMNFCYPQALTSVGDGILGAANVDVADGWTASGGGATGGTALTLQMTDAATPASCRVVYTSSAAASAAATVATTTTGC